MPPANSAQATAISIPPFLGYCECKLAWQGEDRRTAKRSWLGRKFARQERSVPLRGDSLLPRLSSQRECTLSLSQRPLQNTLHSKWREACLQGIQREHPRKETKHVGLYCNSNVRIPRTETCSSCVVDPSRAQTTRTGCGDQAAATCTATIAANIAKRRHRTRTNHLSR